MIEDKVRRFFAWAYIVIAFCFLTIAVMRALVPRDFPAYLYGPLTHAIVHRAAGFPMDNCVGVDAKGRLIPVDCKGYKWPAKETR